jgi:hypothetical protein
MSISIEKGVPIPKTVTRHGSGAFPFKDLDIGDSFFAETSSAEDPRAAVLRIQRLAAVKAKASQQKFITRSITDAGVTVGVRVWRQE